MTFPSTLSSFNRPASTDRLNSPSHSALHNTVSSALGQVEAVIGVEGNSSVVGTLEYLIKSPGSDGGGHIQSANKGGTGQNNYMQGDILVAQSSSVLTKLAVGADGAVLKANSSVATGVQWGSIPGNPTIRVYGTPSILNWVKPSVLSYLVVEVVGGGGNGAAGSDTLRTGGGGGGGGYSKRLIPSSSLGATVLVTVPNSGATATFGGYVQATGGSNGATSASNNTVGQGGVGGVGSLGDINVIGQGGGHVGGSSPLGGGGAGSGPNSAGTVGGNFGGGGSGGTSAGNAGGNGAGGIIIVYEY